MFKFALKKQSSPQTEETEETMNISKFPLLYATPAKERQLTKQTSSSSMTSYYDIKQHTERSPLNFTSIQESSSSHSPLCSTAMAESCCSCCRNGATTISDYDNEEGFASVNASFFDADNHNHNSQESMLLYVCCKEFEASHSSQLSLAYSDLVVLIYAKGEFCLVQHESNGKRGYVPKSSISQVREAWVNEKSLCI